MSNHDQTPPPPPESDGPPEGAPYGTPPTAQPTKKSWFARHKILTGILGLFVFFMIIGALAGDGDDVTPSAAPTPTSAQPAGDSAEEGPGSSASSLGSTADEPAAEKATEEEATEEATEEEATEEDATEEEATGEEPVEAGLPGIGDTVTVDDLEVTVLEVETGISYVGPDGWGEEAQGQFVKIHTEVANIGNEALTFYDSEQKLVDEQDRQHSTSSASFYLDEGNLWLTAINPGNRVKGVLLYDIPQDATPTKITVSSGFWGTTADIDLSS
ncbi:DUF4352 domain-containing protein [Ornithinimicrobium sp. Y1847]|uniref:DUF4352 domain-containing protein n=1 Tax=Ornithinimicrobium sp. Y1847 TaxID=3405419 RepID=UPI003B672384